MIVIILSFRMLSCMQTNYDRCWIKIRFNKSSRRRKKRINNNIKTLISLIIKIKIISSHKIKLKINKINKINDETSVKISVEIHNKALDMIEADQKNVFSVRNLNTAWKIISALIAAIQIIQNMIALDHSTLIKLSSKIVTKSNFNLSESTLENAWEHRLYVLAVSAIMIVVIIVIITFTLLMNLNLTSKDHINDQKTNWALSQNWSETEVYLSSSN